MRANGETARITAAQALLQSLWPASIIMTGRPGVRGGPAVVRKSE